MKKLPIGIQTIQKILKEGYVYVDKTLLAYQLIEGGAPHYFLSRPRRFGKSLFIDTLAEILKGNKELFKDCAIYQTDYDWTKYAVLNFDFSTIDIDTKEELQISLKTVVDNLAEAFGVAIKGPSVRFRLQSLVETLAKESKVVVLVDEYDCPIINNLDNPQVAEANRKFLRGFFSTLKSLDRCLKFTFITGVSRFSKVSLFTGPNNLDDITMNAQYAAIAGYTEEELQSAFAEHIQAIAQEQGTTLAEVLATIKHWYNGYRFTRADERVYNPFSTLGYMNEREPKSYWYDTATPSFLIDELKKHPEASLPLEETTANHSELADKSILDQLDIKTLMFQTGYLTIKDYASDSRRYTLSFPNEEVREAFSESLLKHLVPRVATRSTVCEEALIAQNLDSFFAELKSFFAELHYKFFSKASERTYHLMLQCMLRGMGFDVISESSMNLGVIDMLIRLPDLYYLLELKLDKNPEEGLSQIHAQQYHTPHLHQGKQLALVGVNFSSRLRNIDTWSGELLNEAGKKIKVLTPDLKA